MEIDFNLSRVPKPDLGQRVMRQGAVPAPSDAASTQTAASLMAKLNDISLVRPEQVNQAKAAASSGAYPPVELLDRIANLLGVHLTN